MQNNYTLTEVCYTQSARICRRTEQNTYNCDSILFKSIFQVCGLCLVNIYHILVSHSLRMRFLILQRLVSEVEAARYVPWKVE